MQQIKRVVIVIKSLTSGQIYDVLTRLVGDIEPIGDSTIDKERLNNLNTLIEIADLILSDIWGVAEYKDIHMKSVRDAGESAYNWLVANKDWLDHVIEALDYEKYK